MASWEKSQGGESYAGDGGGDAEGYCVSPPLYPPLSHRLFASAGEIGDGYFRQIQPVVANLPYASIPGNHEAGQNFTHYKMRFASVAENAGVASGSNTNMFYSFDDGLAHWVLWNSEAFWAQPLDSQTAMINWLRADLAAANANRAAVPWLIAVAHKAWCVRLPRAARCKRALPLRISLHPPFAPRYPSFQVDGRDDSVPVGRWVRRVENAGRGGHRFFHKRTYSLLRP